MNYLKGVNKVDFSFELKQLNEPWVLCRLKVNFLNIKAVSSDDSGYLLDYDVLQNVKNEPNKRKTSLLVMLKTCLSRVS